MIAKDPLARAGLASMLAARPECAVVGQSGTGDDLQAAVEVYRPDVAVWDLGWDAVEELDGLAELAQSGLPVVALLADQEQAVAAWSAGARSLLLREEEPASLATAVVAVAGGVVALQPSLAESLLPSGREPHGIHAEPLTPRELEVLRLLAEGLPNKSIAYRLAVSEHTVKFHVNSILGKLGARSRTEAVINATRLGFITL